MTLIQSAPKAIPQTSPHTAIVPAGTPNERIRPGADRSARPLPGQVCRRAALEPTVIAPARAESSDPLGRQTICRTIAVAASCTTRLDGSMTRGVPTSRTSTRFQRPITVQSGS